MHGEVVQVDPIRPAFKAPPSNLLELKCDVPLSNFSINFNVRHYTMVSLDGDLKMWTPSSVARGGERAGWFCRSAATHAGVPPPSLHAASFSQDGSLLATVGRCEFNG